MTHEIKNGETTIRIKTELLADFIRDPEKLGQLAELYCAVYKRPPWNLDYTPEEVIAEHNKDIPGSDGVIAYYEHGGKILTYTLGLIGGRDLISKSNNVLLEAKYFGGVLTEPEKELREFWEKADPYVGDNKFLFLYDTMGDESQTEMVKAWLETTIEVGNYISERGIGKMAGMTLNNTKIFKILRRIGAVTFFQKTEVIEGSSLNPVLVYCDDTTKITDGFRKVVMMLQ